MESEAVAAGVGYKGSFSCLTTINLQFEDAKPAAKFLTIVQQCPLHFLHVEISDPVEAQDVLPLAEFIGRFSATLVHLYLGSESPHHYEPLIKYSDVLAVGKCGRLEHLSLPIVAWQLDDIKPLVPSFPILEQLDLTSSHDTTLDLSCLVPIALHCKKLKKLALRINSNYFIPKSWISLTWKNSGYTMLIFSIQHYWPCSSATYHLQLCKFMKAIRDIPAGLR